MQVEVTAFAALRDALCASRFTVELPDLATAATLREHLAAAHPRWRDLILACRIAQGVEFVPEDARLTAGSAVALIPPVSGGASPPAVALTTAPLDAAALARAARSPACGAVVVFEGTVRSPSGGKDVLYLEYEAYEPMARTHMERIVAEARVRWPPGPAFLHHRLGRIAVGETSVVAVAAAPHRHQAFEACRHLIERLKADVPIWKREVFADGSVWVGAPGACAHEEEPAS
jgi:molybdopterin synthase catalytic subunit